MNVIKKFIGEKDNLGRRYFIFLIGLFICSFGVACATKAGLGTSPVAALIVGVIIKYFKKILKPVVDKILPIATCCVDTGHVSDGK